MNISELKAAFPETWKMRLPVATIFLDHRAKGFDFTQDTFCEIVNEFEEREGTDDIRLYQPAQPRDSDKVPGFVTWSLPIYQVEKLLPLCPPWMKAKMEIYEEVNELIELTNQRFDMSQALIADGYTVDEACRKVFDLFKAKSIT